MDDTIDFAPEGIEFWQVVDGLKLVGTWIPVGWELECDADYCASNWAEVLAGAGNEETIVVETVRLCWTY